MEILVIAGIIFVIVISATLWSSKRAIAFSPGEVHMLVGQQVTVYALLYRKKSWSYTLEPSTAPRNITYTNVSQGYFTFPGSNPSVITANGGMGSIVLTGTNQGKSWLKAEAASSQPGRQYGPLNLNVYVYANLGAVPAGATLTPADVEPEE